jgi:hypothetical protein
MGSASFENGIDLQLGTVANTGQPQRFSFEQKFIGADEAEDEGRVRERPAPRTLVHEVSDRHARGKSHFGAATGVVKADRDGNSVHGYSQALIVLRLVKAATEAMSMVSHEREIGARRSSKFG